MIYVYKSEEDPRPEKLVDNFREKKPTVITKINSEGIYTGKFSYKNEVNEDVVIEPAFIFRRDGKNVIFIDDISAYDNEYFDFELLNEFNSVSVPINNLSWGTYSIQENRILIKMTSTGFSQSLYKGILEFGDLFLNKHISFKSIVDEGYKEQISHKGIKLSFKSITENISI